MSYKCVCVDFMGMCYICGLSGEVRRDWVAEQLKYFDVKFLQTPFLLVVMCENPFLLSTYILLLILHITFTGVRDSKLTEIRYKREEIDREIWPKKYFCTTKSFNTTFNMIFLGKKTLMNSQH